jgi:lipoprotein-anchoring transpeptidase ErfK/SrfK
MRRYLIIAGVLVLGGAIGLLFPLPGSRTAAPSPEPDKAVGQSQDGPDSGELGSLSVPVLSAHTPLGDSLALRGGELSIGTKTVEQAATGTAGMAGTASPEELLKIVREQLDTPEAIEAAKTLIPVFEKQGNEAMALTMRLAAAAESERPGILEKINALYRDFFTPEKPHAKAIFHTVTREDRNLTVLGKHYKITPGFIMRMNGLKNDTIIVGQRLKVVQGPFWAVVDKSSYRLTVYLGDELFREYRIGLGKNNSTPTGSFTVLAKLTQPTYWVEGAHYDFGDPNNPLGTRWITFKDEGYGIHGTWEPESIGKQMSHGCVRMRNEDVEELYDLLVKHDSRIVIKD